MHRSDSLISFARAANTLRLVLLGDINARIWLLIPFVFVLILNPAVDNLPFFFYTFTIAAWWMRSTLVRKLDDHRLKWITDFPFLVILSLLEAVSLILSLASLGQATSAWAILNVSIIALVILCDLIGTMSLAAVVYHSHLDRFFRMFYEVKVARIHRQLRYKWHQIDTTIVIFEIPIRYIGNDEDEEEEDGEEQQHHNDAATTVLAHPRDLL
jgi:hypothetical protein